MERKKQKKLIYILYTRRKRNPMFIYINDKQKNKMKETHNIFLSFIIVIIEISCKIKKLSFRKKKEKEENFYNNH
jgi:hypothetical protein